MSAGNIRGGLLAAAALGAGLLLIFHASSTLALFPVLQSSQGLGFGGLWFLYVGRSIYLALVLVWLWRIVVVSVLMWRVARLELSLVPTHPDRFVFDGV